jgi:surface protein
MPDWDVSLVTDMAFDDGNGLFRDKWAFNADISRWDTSSVTDMGYHVYGRIGVQRGHLGLEHELRDEHGEHV